MEKQRSEKRFFAEKTTETAAPADTREKSQLYIPSETQYVKQINIE